MDNPNEINNMTCKPCEGIGSTLTTEQAMDWLKQVPNWQLDKQNECVWRLFEFKGYYKTMSFVNAVAWIANQQGHHPTLEVNFNSCKVIYTTHAINGLSPNDFICAAKIDELLT